MILEGARRLFSPATTAPEWRWIWRDLAGLWRFSEPATAPNLATRNPLANGADAGGGFFSADGASVAATPFGRGWAGGGGFGPTPNADPGFWHDAFDERTIFGACVVAGGTGEQNVFFEGGGAGQIRLAYGVGATEFRAQFQPGNAQITLDWPLDPNKLAAWVLTVQGQDCVFYVNGVLVGTDSISGAVGDHGSGLTVWDFSSVSDGALLMLGAATRAWSAGEARHWTADPWGPLRVWRTKSAGGAGSTTHPLAGELTLSLAPSGALGVRRGLGGAVALELAPSSGLAVRRGLGGAAALALAPSGVLDVRRALGGTLPFALQLNGALEGSMTAPGELAVGDSGLGAAALSDASIGALALATAKHGDLEVSDAQ